MSSLYPLEGDTDDDEVDCCEFASIFVAFVSSGSVCGEVTESSCRSLREKRRQGLYE